jgi:hypothetical protein
LRRSRMRSGEWMRAGRALSCEDGIVFADAALRAKLKARHSAVVERIEARRNFVRDELGLPIRDSILPLSSTPYAPALLACAQTIAGAGTTAVDNKRARKAVT